MATLKLRDITWMPGLCLQLESCLLQGVCRHVSGLVVFTDALPGEELTARVNKVKKGELYVQNTPL